LASLKNKYGLRDRNYGLRDIKYGLRAANNRLKKILQKIAKGFRDIPVNLWTQSSLIVQPQ